MSETQSEDLDTQDHERQMMRGSAGNSSAAPVQRRADPGRRAPSSSGPGKRSRAEGVARRGAPLVQRYAANPNATTASQIRETAQAGLSGGGGGALPHASAIQQSFGRHDVGSISAHVGGRAGEAAEAMGAEAYATGSSVAFRKSPDLHTTAHEAAHVVQQRAGVSLAGGVGSVGDRHEQHADAVADRVVRGESAESLLDQYGGGASAGAGQVQGKASCACGDCAICKAREQGGGQAATGATPGKGAAGVQAMASEEAPVQAMASEAPVQMDLLDDAAQVVHNAAEAVGNFIDLLGPKMDLMRKITDPSWIVDEVTLAIGNDAHPQHALMLNVELVGIGVSAGLGAMGYANRIAPCNDLEAVQALDTEFDTWRAEQAATLTGDLDAKVEEYREIERGWLTTFGAHAPIVKDPANPNQGGQPVSITFTPGVPQSTVTVETRVNCTFGLTTAAQADNDGDGAPDVAAWTPDEQAHFMSQFQRQLDDVWSTGAGAVAPFRASAPPDHLLATESPKWTELTATMQARVTADASNPHFNLNVFKEAATESNRAFVGSGGTGTFYIADADAGYHRSGPDAGQRNPDEQPTLAHEWHHMIGNPDEYAEDSSSQSADPNTPATRSGDNAACLAHFNTIINDPASTPEQKAQAQADIAALNAHATDTDPSTPGFQSGIFPLAGRSDVPDSCFAIRGTWADGPDHARLRPGARSQRGGTNISASAADAARLSDRGSQVRPYMREGIVQELGTMLPGQFTPEVSFDHNFADMPPATVFETIQARLQNILHDVNVGATSAPSPAPGDRVPAGPHNHGDGDGHDH